jgi:ligand-binding sensor domain-containing protein
MARKRMVSFLGLVVWFTLLPGNGLLSTAAAQDVQIETFVRAKECRDLLVYDQHLYGGLVDGGVVVFERDDPARYRRWTTGDGLSGNNVRDLAVTGRHLWVATERSGLTRVDLQTQPPQFRKFTDIGGLQTTSVTGRIRDGNEVVFYGLAEDGLGQINDGLPFAIYTAEEHGLIDNHVTALAILGDELWVGTPVGLSRFVDNLFTDRNEGLTDRNIRTLVAVGDTLLLAGTNDGVSFWDADAGQWSKLSGLDLWVDAVAVTDEGIWALATGDGAEDRLWRYDEATWTSTPLPSTLSRTLAADADLWVAGEIRQTGMSFRTGQAFLARRAEGGWDSWRVDELLLLNVDGCAFGPDGSLWLGSRTGQGVDRFHAGEWSHIYELATAENDSNGLFAFGANILGLTTLPNGEVWLSQRTQGVIRFVPAGTAGQAEDLYDHITAENSGLSENLIRQIVRHPDGPLLLLSENQGADVLLNPALWRDPSQWLHLPTGTPGLGGNSSWDAAVASRDVIWFAVDQVGIVGWDLNGSSGAGAALTWSDPSDDVWYAPIGSLSGTAFDPGGTRGLAVDTEGAVWAGGGGGVVRFRYNTTLNQAILLSSYRQKNDAFSVGLLTGSVTDIELDRNDDLWVAMDAGLNRIRLRGDNTLIDAYTDLVSYFGYDLGSLYSPGIITGLPGGQTIWQLSAEAGGRRILVGADAGVALLTISSLGGPGDNPLAGLYLYPNPFRPQANGPKLKLGGILAEVSLSGLLERGGAFVEVYNLEGQRIFQDPHVANDEGFWDGRNFLSEFVSSGLYVVKVSLAGRTEIMTLAIVR